MSESKTDIDTNGGLGLDDQTSTTQDDNREFAWRVCMETDAHKRLSLKEQSLEQGLQHCAELITILDAGFGNITKHSKQAADSIWPSDNRKDWINQCHDIIRDHQDFRVLVGVAGATGSGKTSALNALLGFRELLPTNNEEAATAVQCKVAFNDDIRPEYAFRCHVTFQSKQVLETRLKKFFDDLEARNELEESHNGSAEDEDALRDFESMLRPTSEMINIVFGLQDDQVEMLGFDGVLQSNPDALELLGTVKEFHDANAEAISEKMKPYMDSTAADHSISGARFAAWPLIEQVELYVKSDILRNGVVLVDLPGLGDAVESRALVAQRSFDQLTATLIVAQAPRAADNSTAVDLMSKHQEIAMMLDGKFHKQTFCVCLSQIDQIDRKAALRKPDARADTDLQSWLNEEESHKRSLKTKLQEQKRAKKQMNKLRMALRKPRKPLGKKEVDLAKEAAAKATQHKIKGEKRGQKLLIARTSQEISASKRRLIELDGIITFNCIQARNQFLQDRIERDFRKRQARLFTKNSGSMQKTYDGQVSVCPTSAKAFWKCKSPINRMTGFPTEAYTGIPGLASWIRSATVPKREEHVDDLLNRLHAQYNIIQLWSKDKCKLSNTPITKDSFEEHILADVLKTMEQSLTASWSQLYAEVVKMNPLNNKKGQLDKCPGLCAQAVRGWAYKKPDDKASDDKVHWATYKANLSRSGGKFVSKSKAQTQEYNWMEDISHILFRTIVEDWNRSLNHDIPSLTSYAWPVIDQIWDSFIMDLNMSIANIEPRLLTEFMNEKPSLETIKTKTKNKVRQALKRISKQASQSHPLVVRRFQSEWEGTFRNALAIRGTGAHTARQQVLLRFATEESQKTFNTSYDYLQDQLQMTFDKLPEELNSIAEFAIGDLRRHIGVLLNKLLESADLALKMEAVASEELRLQQSIKETLLNLTLHWKFPATANDVHDHEAGHQLPQEYRHVQTELEQLEDDDYEINSDSDSNDDENTDDEKFSDAGGDEDTEVKN
ncbi:hypothetical protein HD806DRAFT_546877 [Xylariaceae sp. AK1471]|nr:hypothetical protein HD806DRAFT_546877 [Xylariaceae sp. AK1471]